MDKNKLAEAVLKLAEVHDRRLGEIGTALGRLADQMTHSSPFDGKPLSGVDHIADEISGAIVTLAEAVDKLPLPPVVD